jgi:hypothetical protein
LLLTPPAVLALCESPFLVCQMDSRVCFFRILRTFILDLALTLSLSVQSSQSIGTFLPYGFHKFQSKQLIG